MMPEELLVLVDENDRQTGLKDKLQVHRDGDLHRAFSVFIFNTKGQMLLQRRALDKYHSGGLWTNACCSHPRQEEDIKTAAQRRLKEELGMECDTLSFAFSFIYKATLSNGLTEHEFDHVFLCRTDATPVPDPLEVSECKYVSLPEIEKDLLLHPDNYTAWFKIIFNRAKESFLK